MIQKKLGQVEWLEFELLSGIPELSHAVFLRHGGVSQGPFASLNLGDRVEDIPSCVKANRERVAQLLSLPHLVVASQCHGDTVIEVNQDLLFDLPPCDALVTEQPSIGLMVTHADCQAAILYDPRHHVVAVVHSGWRGSVQNIFGKTVTFLQGRFGSKPKELLACIGPSLGPEESEFIHFQDELPPSFWDFQIKPTFFDFWSISREQLLDCGLLPHHLEIAKISTFANSKDYYSYRRDKITGRHGTVVALKY